jgi:hypothetical protein
MGIALMTDPPIPLLDENSALARGFRGCLLALFAMTSLCLCLFVVYLREGNIRRLLKSFEFPAIEARFKPIADEFVIVTSDVLVDEYHAIGNVTTMTHETYTGEVAGHFTKVFATDRSLDSVLEDYARFFSAKPDWKVDKTSSPLAGKTDYTAEIYVTLTDDSEYSRARARYRTVYKVKLFYGDPKIPGI